MARVPIVQEDDPTAPADARLFTGGWASARRSAGVYDPQQAAIVRYAQKATRLEPIDHQTYNGLASHFSTQQIMDICLTVGLSNMVNRFHATFRTDVDQATLAAVAAGDAIAGSCPIPIPKPPK